MEWKKMFSNHTSDKWLVSTYPRNWYNLIAKLPNNPI